MRYSREFVRTLHKSLPEDLQELIASPDTLDVLDTVSEKYSLDGSQTQRLQYELMLLILGITPAERFSQTLCEQLQISNEISLAITKEIYTSILSKVPEEHAHAQEEYAQAKLAEAGVNAIITPAQPPEIAAEIHPALEEGEVAHDVPHVESSPAQALAPSTETEVPAPASDQTPAAETVSAPETVPETTPEIQKETPPPAPTYAPGKDPYREPLE